MSSIIRDIFCFDFRSNFLVSFFFSDKYRKGNVPTGVPYFCVYFSYLVLLSVF